MKKYRLIITFLLIVSFVHLFVTWRDYPGKYGFILIIPIIFSLQQIIRCIIDFSKRRLYLGLISLIISILFLNLTLKAIFVYYNSLIHLIFILISIYILFEKKFKADHLIRLKKKFILLPILSLSVIIFIISDGVFLNWIHLKQDEYISNYNNITWENFKGRIDTTSSHDASINIRQVYLVNKTFSYPQIICRPKINPFLSWKKGNSEELLKHEKLHFLISEIFAERINNLNEDWPLPTDSIYARVQTILESSMIMQNEFDNETSHGVNLEKQLIWEKKLMQIINK